MSDDDFDWSLRRGRTPTGRTGPDADHSYGNTSGTYIHIESSNRLFMERAKIESPIMNSFLLGQNQCEFSLYYHMYGDDVWELRACVQMLADGSCFQGNPVVASSNQGNIWKKYTQALPASQGQFKVFEYFHLCHTSNNSKTPTQGTRIQITDISVTVAFIP
ncbi:MAM and LDL-receptor class A domain-containing protein 1-like [Lingula anatina]|uniref:MAM and LDL-receptor class A domain-containing protein 1-like n=1 Tax=Lingula anatina TaxID=7574 RepID=A0A2R2MI74_LINAN|nr:MAM and LDL-receptor class A domain-containing protein 1-like [Lingula anatina]|eukprot:XP_023929913.1 MAM and LDL-receptor class A domain-containing protein 1-like [Lingula anatina]